MTFLVGWLYSAVYYKVGAVGGDKPATIATIQSVMGVLFSSSNFTGMTNLMVRLVECVWGWVPLSWQDRARVAIPQQGVW